VRVGDLATRSQIKTGDEFEDLSDTFNEMLEALQRNQDQLRAINKALDVKLNELAESNTALHESAKLKGEFVAGISHELRTPMNSIIGFGELLLEIARAEQNAGDDSTRLAKRIRYLDNIVNAARTLLDMINSLLEMARIEAGRIDVNVERVSVLEACEGLVGLIHPQAEREGVTVRLEVADDLPIIQTDLRKLQQIVSNFLANAVKFVRAGGEGADKPLVILRAERLGPSTESDQATERVRISVIDNGPGIAQQDQARVFEKFEQLDAGHTRKHAGSGLGLAISRELAGVIQGEIQVISDVGRGSMFSLILPIAMDEARSAEVRLEAAFRGTLAGRRSMT
jgi:signal transduction histidine kinase